MTFERMVGIVAIGFASPTGHIASDDFEDVMANNAYPADKKQRFIANSRFVQ